MSSSLTKSFSVPQLPGYRRKFNNVVKGKGKDFEFVNGYPMEISPVMKKHTKSLRAAKSASNLPVVKRNLPALLKGPTLGVAMSSPPKWLAHDRKVLFFNAFFKEAVCEAAVENCRIRYCEIYFYLADESIHVSEPKVENSGIPQGIFIKRHRIPKGESGQFFGIYDLIVGQDIVLYGRRLHISNCNESTRQYYSKIGIDQSFEELPKDNYTTLREGIMQLETGADTSIYRGVTMNNTKAWMEANQGKHMRDSEVLAKYLSQDRKVLRFDCGWDDRSRYAGTIQKYKLHFFLANDYVEIMELPTKNNGRDKFPRLLNRAILPKDFSKSNAGHYLWSDFQLGGVINVYGRQITLLDCDKFTRDFYQNKGIDLGTEFIMELPARVVPKIIPPPHTGLGSEEDSLGSCMSLCPKPPRKDMKKLMEMDRKILRFSAVFSDAKPEDSGRKFLVNYYLADDTMSVSEPPKRNSGIIGGKFLARGKYKTADGSWFKPSDFTIGGTITLRMHRFQLLDTDLFTVRFMEGNPDAFPDSDVSAIIKKLTLKLRKENSTIGKTFRLVDKNHSGFISISELKTLLSHFFTGEDLKPQAILTIMRYFDKDAEGIIDVTEFAKGIFATDVKSSSHEIGGGLGGDDIIIPEVTKDYADICYAADAKDQSHFLEEKVLYQFGNHCKNRGIGLHNVFRIFDTDRSGFLEDEEFKTMLRSNDFIPGDMPDENVEIIYKFFFGDKKVVDMREFRDRLLQVFKDYESKEMSRILHRGTGDVGY